MRKLGGAVQVLLLKNDAPTPNTTYKGVIQDFDKAFVKK